LLVFMKSCLREEMLGKTMAVSGTLFLTCHLKLISSTIVH
jgi:hypothetical protein